MQDECANSLCMWWKRNAKVASAFISIQSERVKTD